jgi:hypothetical protein
LAIDALIDTNYRTYFNKYLMHTQIPAYLKNQNAPVSGYDADWIDLLKRLDILEQRINEDGTKVL